MHWLLVKNTFAEIRMRIRETRKTKGRVVREIELRPLLPSSASKRVKLRGIMLGEKGKDDNGRKEGRKERALLKVRRKSWESWGENCEGGDGGTRTGR